ncbi:MAG: hypothetical protein EXS36_05040 [Pedosphaera sp.]|nr:hypothetical protein [Pedosphaera sp.]
MDFYRFSWFQAGVLALTLIGLVSGRAFGVDKGNNPDNLNLGSSWLLGVAPTSADVASWTSASAGSSFNLGADLSWAGLVIGNPSSAVTFNAGNTLTLGVSGIDMTAATVTFTMKNAVVLGANKSWTVASGRQLQLVGTLTEGGITGTGMALNVGGSGSTFLFGEAGGINTGAGGTLTKVGSGTLEIHSPGNYTGSTFINDGTLSVHNGEALGTAAGSVTVVSGASLLLDTSLYVAKPLTLNGKGYGGGGALVGEFFSEVPGPITLGSDTKIRGNLNLLGQITGTGFGLTVDIFNSVFISGGLNTSTGGTLTKYGSGILYISAGSDYTGATIINEGVLSILDNGTLGTSSGVSVASGAALELNGSSISVGSIGLTLNGAGVSFDGALRNNGDGSYAGAITLGSDSQINSDGTLMLSGGITGTGRALTVGGYGNTTIDSIGIMTGAGGSLTKDGAGTLTITAGSDYTVAAFINEGILNIQHDDALGTSSGVTVYYGATLQLLGTRYVMGSIGLTLNGEGVSSGGALQSIFGQNTVAGAITLGSASRINSDADVLYLTCGITGTGMALTVGGSGATLISGGGINTGVDGTLTKDGSGTLEIDSAGNYTGETLINEGSLHVMHGDALGTSSGVTVYNGASLALAGNISIGSMGLTLNGEGDSSTGALLNLGGANSYAGAITLGSASRINSNYKANG